MYRPGRTLGKLNVPFAAGRTLSVESGAMPISRTVMFATGRFCESITVPAMDPGGLVPAREL